MAQTTAISRRMKDCICRLQEGNFEGALVDLFPALDKTAQKRRPTLGVGARIKAFLDDEELLIHSLALGRAMSTKIRVKEMAFSDVIYKFGRSAILHEGELDSRLKFSKANIIEIGVDQWHLSTNYITAMTIAVIAAPENQRESIDGTLKTTIFEREFAINELWGKKEEVNSLIFGK
jgi:hypothetical protein